MKRLLTRLPLPAPGELFSGQYVDVRVLYLQYFRRIPQVGLVSEIDLTRAYAHIQENHRGQVQQLLQQVYYDHDQRECLFNTSIFVLQGRRMVELENNCALLLYPPEERTWAGGLMQQLAAFRQEEVQAPVRDLIGFVRSNR